MKLRCVAFHIVKHYIFESFKFYSKSYYNIFDTLVQRHFLVFVL
jgi:hypothetical protein